MLLLALLCLAALACLCLRFAAERCRSAVFRQKWFLALVETRFARLYESELVVVRGAFALLLTLLIFAPTARAQNATSFVNITGITVKRLGNAVVVRVETDGTVRFGGDFRDWIDVDNGFRPKPTTSIRLRIVQARAKVPAYVPIDAYPVDGAAISLGRTAFLNPFFADGAYGQPQPVVDVQLLFATPIIIRNFSPQPGRSTGYRSYLGPKEASVELSSNRRAIVITVVPDRADLLATQHLNRLPLAERKMRLSVLPLDGSAFRVEALHMPLRDLLSGVATVTGEQFAARPEVADVPVSLCLPRTSPAAFARALATATNLGTRDEDGATIFGRGDEFFASRSLPLRNLTPDQARLLFPDFLLPFLRADREHNALVAVQTPAMLDKMEAQLRVLDTERAQFEVSAQFWELTRTKNTNSALSLVRSLGGDTETLDASTGILVGTFAPGRTAQLQTTLQLLSVRGRARLAATSKVVALSGAPATLFSGQTRYVQVLRNNYNGTSAIALALQVGASLDVTARGSNELSDPIRLDVAPKLSTVDSIEAKTGLPTIGIRELSGTLLLRGKESGVFAGLESDTDFFTRSKTLRLIPAQRGNREVRSLLVVVTAQRLTWTEPSKDAASGKRRWVAINPQMP